jgi:hypothetical protein
MSTTNALGLSTDRAYWLNLSRCIVRAAIDDPLHEQIADYCTLAAKENRNCSIWHALAQVTGHKCHCAACERPARRAAT